MKKFIVLFFLVMSFTLIFAELVIDIPFDTDIVGQDFSVTGPYEYESEWITVTNTGTETQAYIFQYTNQHPVGWTMSVCNPTFCLAPNWPVDMELQPGEYEELHILVTVTSTDAFDFSFTFEGGDITEPIVVPFTFRTEDYIVAADDNVVQPKLTQNYPNPFNPATTIEFDLTPQESATAKIAIYNVKGQIVKTFDDLYNGSVTWNGIDNIGKKVDSGIYFYQLTAGARSETRKMVLLK